MRIAHRLGVLCGGLALAVGSTFAIAPAAHADEAACMKYLEANGLTNADIGGEPGALTLNGACKRAMKGGADNLERCVDQLGFFGASNAVAKEACRRASLSSGRAPR